MRLVDADNLLEQSARIVADDGMNATEKIGRIIIAITEDAAVGAAEVMHGRWEQVQRWATKAKYRCSVCGREIMSAAKVNIEKYPYCHCGAKMNGGEGDS